jgi:hypothetical protein
MSLSIGAVGSLPSFDVADTSAAPTPAPKLSESQQMQQLEHAGQSTKQIATTLGLPETLVDESLGITTAATAVVTTIPGALSIHA